MKKMSTQIILSQIKVPNTASVGAVVTVQADGTFSANGRCVYFGTGNQGSYTKSSYSTRVRGMRRVAVQF